MIEQLIGLVISTMAVIALVDVIRWQIRSKTDDVYLDPTEEGV